MQPASDLEILGRTFTDAVGSAALDHLRKLFLNQSVNIREATALQLAYIEGQRALIRYIEEKVKQWQTNPQ